MRPILQLQKVAQLTGHNAAVFCLEPGREPPLFISGAGDGWIVEWDVRNPEMGRLLAKVETQIFSLKFLPEENLVVAGNMNGGVHWVDLSNPEETLNIAHHQKGVFAFARVEDSLFSLGGEGMLTRWSVSERKSLDSLHLSNKSLRCIDYSIQRNELAIGASDHTIYLLDATSLEIRQTIADAHENSVFSLHYSADGQRLLSGGRDAFLKVWDLEEIPLITWAEPAHLYTVNRIASSPDNRYWATASRDKTVKLWDATSMDLLKVLEGYRDKGHFNSVNTLLWRGEYLISGSDDRTMILWKLMA